MTRQSIRDHGDKLLATAAGSGQTSTPHHRNNSKNSHPDLTGFVFSHNDAVFL